MDMIDKIIDYETGNLDNAGILSLFGELIETGQAWSLQGSYGRTANTLIEQGLISPTGEINQVLVNELLEA